MSEAFPRVAAPERESYLGLAKRANEEDRRRCLNASTARAAHAPIATIPSGIPTRRDMLDCSVFIHMSVKLGRIIIYLSSQMYMLTRLYN